MFFRLLSYPHIHRVQYLATQAVAVPGLIIPQLIGSPSVLYRLPRLLHDVAALDDLLFDLGLFEIAALAPPLARAPAVHLDQLLLDQVLAQ